MLGRIVLVTASLALIACTSPSEEASGAAAGGALVTTPVACQDHAGSAFALTRLTLERADDATFTVEYRYWLQDPVAVGGTEGAPVPDDAQHWTVARDVRCWSGAELDAHVRPVRRLQPARSTSRAVVYCESADRKTQVLFEKEVVQNVAGAGGPWTVTGINVIVDAPNLASILPPARLTTLNTLFESYVQRNVSAAETVTYDNCTFPGIGG